MKKFLLAISLIMVAATIILSGCGGKQQDTSWEKVKEKGEFVLGLDDSFPPMGFRDENGQIVGFDVDLAKEVCNRLGVKLKLQPISWDAKEQELNSGNIDCIWNGLTITEERKRNMLFSEAYMKNRQVLVVKADAPYENLTDLENKRLGLQAGSSAAVALESSGTFKEELKDVVEFDDNMIALMDLEKGGVDVVLMDEIVARYYIQQKNKNFKVLDETLASEEYGIGFRKNDKQLMAKIQETLDAMASDGKLAEISKSGLAKILLQ